MPEAQALAVGGRPTSYKREFAKQAEKLCELGATDSDLAEFFDVSTRTIARWASEHKEFCQVLKESKDFANQRVERSLYHRAMGYNHPAVKIFMPAGAEKPVYAEYIEHVPPDVTAQIFWLKNRDRDRWRDKVDMTVTVDDRAVERKTALLGMVLSLIKASEAGADLPQEALDFLAAVRGEPVKVIEG